MGKNIRLTKATTDLIDALTFLISRIKRHHRLPVVLSAILVVIFVNSTQADVLVLRDGQRFEGTLSNRAIVRSDPASFQQISFLIDSATQTPRLQTYDVEAVEYVLLEDGADTDVIDFWQAAVGLVGGAAALPDEPEASRSEPVLWRAGFLGGVNLGGWNGDDSKQFGDLRTGFVVGGFISAGLTRNSLLMVQGLYSQKGAKGSRTEDGHTAEVEFRMDYFEIPLLAVGRVPMGNTVGLNLFAGPTIAFLISARSMADGFEEVGILGLDGEHEFTDNVDSVDVGLMIGVGINIVVSEFTSFVINASYDHGLTMWDNTEPKLDVTNSAIGITAGFSFPLGKGGS